MNCSAPKAPSHTAHTHSDCTDVITHVLKVLMMTFSQMDQPTDFPGDNLVSEARAGHGTSTSAGALTTHLHPACHLIDGANLCPLEQTCADDDLQH